MNAEVFLHTHSLQNTVGLQLFRSHVENALISSSGKVAVLLEGVGLDAQAGQNIETFISLGVSPATAISFGSITPNESNIAQLRSGRQEADVAELKAVLEIAHDGPSHALEEVMILDDLYFRYTNPDHGSRLLVLFETGRDLVSYGAATSPDYDNFCGFAIAGDLRTALPFFKTTAEKVAIDSRRREEHIATRIATLKKPDLEHIIIPFGATHTPIHHLLRKAGVNSAMFFADRVEDEREIIYDPMCATIRQCRFFGPASITELNWYRAMIGAITHDVLWLMEADQTVSSDFLKTQHEINWIARRVARKVRSLTDVEEFERLATEMNIVQAIETLESRSE